MKLQAFPKLLTLMAFLMLALKSCSPILAQAESISLPQNSRKASDYSNNRVKTFFRPLMTSVALGFGALSLNTLTVALIAKQPKLCITSALALLVSIVFVFQNDQPLHLCSCNK
ncbi:MAG TPA: hypothetical protein VHA52_06775 [Candidatus Babeliaceae bacterium]|nr:hypothetical protein [Candidatus Babeliaceae bacterium]